MYIFGWEDEPMRICSTRADAEECLLTFAEEAADELYNDLSCQTLKQVSRNMWIQEADCY